MELDPALFELARAYRGAGADPPHVARVAADGRAFVKRAAPGAYDLILISMGEPDTATVNRYYTLEFFRECRRAMADGGILVLVLPTYGGGTDYTGESLAARSARPRSPGSSSPRPNMPARSRSTRPNWAGAWPRGRRRRPCRP